MEQPFSTLTVGTLFVYEDKLYVTLPVMSARLLADMNNYSASIESKTTTLPADTLVRRAMFMSDEERLVRSAAVDLADAVLLKIPENHPQMIACKRVYEQRRSKCYSLKAEDYIQGCINQGIKVETSYAVKSGWYVRVRKNGHSYFAEGDNKAEAFKAVIQKVKTHEAVLNGNS